MNRLTASLIALVLIAIISPSFVAEAQTATPTPTPIPDYDWCYTFDFEDEEDYGIIFMRGEFVPFSGLTSEFVGGNHLLEFVYTHDRTVAPLEVIAYFERSGITAGTANISVSASVFGVGHTPDPIHFVLGDIDEYPLVLMPDGPGESGTFFHFQVHGTQPVKVNFLTVRGNGANPFDSNDCNLTPTPTATPWFPPTDIPTNTPAPTYTPIPACVTGTPAPTATPSPTSTSIPTTQTVTFDASGYTDYSFPTRAAYPQWPEQSNQETGSELGGGTGERARNGASFNSSGATWVNGVRVRVNVPSYVGTITSVSFQAASHVVGLGNHDVEEDILFYDSGGSLIPGGVGTVVTRASNSWYQKTAATVSITGAAYIDYITLNAGTAAQINTTGGAFWVMDNLVFTYTLATPTATPTGSPTPTANPVCSPTPTLTPTPTSTPTPFTITPTPSRTPSNTPFPVFIPTSLPTASRTPNPTAAATHTPPPGTPLTATATLAATSTAGIPPTLTGGAGVGGIGLPDLGPAGELADMGNNVIGFIGNLWNKVTGWVTQLGGTVTGITTTWETAVPTAPPMMPECATDPIAYEVCAIWYLLRYTIFAGEIGSLIIPAFVIDVYLFFLFFIVKLIRAILARAGEVNRA